MATYVSNAISTILTSQLPFNPATNMAVGIAGGQLSTIILEKTTNMEEWFWTLIGRNRNLVKVCAKENGRYNPIYEKLETYILERYAEQLKQVNLAPSKGEITFDLRDGLFRTPIEDSFEGKTVYLELSNEKTIQAKLQNINEDDSDNEESDSLTIGDNIDLDINDINDIDVRSSKPFKLKEENIIIDDIEFVTP